MSNLHTYLHPGVKGMQIRHLPNVMANLSNLNKLPNTRVFVAAENGSVKVLELMALFLLKTGAFSA